MSHHHVFAGIQRVVVRPLRRRVLLPAIGLVMGLAVTPGCDKDSMPKSPVSPSAPTATVASTAEAVLVGAGDIGMCGGPGPQTTAGLLDRIAGAVFTAGDNAYMHGSAADFQCYDRTWGRHRSRTYPTPGNHEYETPGASAYFDYFGERAGPSGLGYYSFDLAAWHLVSLNSNVAIGEGSAQLAWLRADLQQARVPCVAAIVHHPLVSSGPNGDNPRLRDVWRVLIEAGADVVISGHDHMFERHARIDQDGRPAPRGVRQFIVGTGGATLYQSSATRPTTEAKVIAWGVARFSLLPNSYRWEFHTADGIADSGLDQCL